MKSMNGSSVNVESPMPLDTRGTLNGDTGKGGRVNGKETMARRRYQEGSLFSRGRVGRRVWVARCREDVLESDGTVGRGMRPQVRGPVRSSPTNRHARQMRNTTLRSISQR